MIFKENLLRFKRIQTDNSIKNTKTIHDINEKFSKEIIKKNHSEIVVLKTQQINIYI